MQSQVIDFSTDAAQTDRRREAIARALRSFADSVLERNIPAADNMQIRRFPELLR